MSEQKELVSELKEVLAKYNIPSAVIAIPLEPGEFFLMMHYARVDDIQKLGMLLSEYHLSVPANQLN